jgi:hypothetical protein
LRKDEAVAAPGLCAGVGNAIVAETIREGAGLVIIAPSVDVARTGRRSPPQGAADATTITGGITALNAD